MELISREEYKKLKEDAKNGSKEEKIKQTILNSIDNELAQKTTKEVWKNGQVKIVKVRSNIKRNNGQVLFELKYGQYLFAAIKLDNKNIEKTLTEARESIANGGLDKMIKEYVKSPEFKSLQGRFK